MFLPKSQIAGHVPASMGNLARTSKRPYLKANFELSRADVYCFVIPWSVKFSFLATTFRNPLFTYELASRFV